MLTQLDSSPPSPAVKAAILVAAHKVIVGKHDFVYSVISTLTGAADGLSTLPPIRLKSETEPKESQTELIQRDDSGPADVSPVPTTPAKTFPVTTLPNVLPVPNLDEETASMDSTAMLNQSTPRSLGQEKRDSEPVATLPVGSKPTPVSGDILLPLIIFSVVKANPPRLVSHLLYTQRFRNQSVGGEESYCLVNLMAVAEFLENVDLAALGLVDSENKILRFVHNTRYQISIVGLQSDPVLPH